MLGIFKWILSGVNAFGCALVMPFRRAKSSSRWRSFFRWSVHVLCLLGVLAGLGFLNYSLQLDTVLRAPASWLRAAWLPLVAFQVYVLSWIGWWLCRTITTQRHDAEHPDLQRAWGRVASSLELASIDIKTTPLFLILGQPVQPMASFFSAGQVPLKIPVAPADPTSTFHLYANDDAIYLCCEETSLLGRQASQINAASSQVVRSQSKHRMALDTKPAHEFPTSLDRSNHRAAPLQRAVVGETGLASNGGGIALATDSPPTATAINGDIGIGSNNDRESGLQVASRSLNLIETNLALAESADLHGRTIESSTNVYQPARKLKLPMLQDELEIDTTLSRLNFLCELIHQARHPICPINGVAVLIPFGATENEEIANHVGMLIEQDLETVRSATMVEAPRIAVVCDLQNATGCLDLLTRFPPQQQHRRLGIELPQVPACDLSQSRKMVADGLDWLCQKMVPPLVNRLFSDESADRSGDADSCDAINQRLYRFTQVLRDRQNNIERVIRRAFFGDFKREALLRGIYLSASGHDSVNEHGFTAGIFAQISELQNDICWTPEAIDRNNNFRRWSLLGYTAISTIVVVVITCLLL